MVSEMQAELIDDLIETVKCEKKLNQSDELNENTLGIIHNVFECIRNLSLSEGYNQDKRRRDALEDSIETLEKLYLDLVDEIIILRRNNK